MAGEEALRQGARNNERGKSYCWTTHPFEDISPILVTPSLAGEAYKGGGVMW